MRHPSPQHLKPLSGVAVDASLSLTRQIPSVLQPAGTFLKFPLLSMPTATLAQATFPSLGLPAQRPPRSFCPQHSQLAPHSATRRVFLIVYLVIPTGYWGRGGRSLPQPPGLWVLGCRHRKAPPAPQLAPAPSQLVHKAQPRASGPFSGFALQGSFIRPLGSAQTLLPQRDLPTPRLKTPAQASLRDSCSSP